jgi:branched-chain amino acid transport system ATP-binding protein
MTTHSVTTKAFTDSEPLLSVSDLSKNFGGLMAINTVNMSVFKGEIVGLIGPNGAGKTTMFNLIAGFLTPEKGQVTFQGENITGVKSHKICQQGIARTFQIPRPFQHLTVLENMMVGTGFGAGFFNGKKAFEKIDKILDMAGLSDKIFQHAESLNLVERKKLEIARALSTEPKLILLDEVIGGLNPTEVLEMIELIKKLRDMGLSILLIEHLMKVIMTLSDRVVVLHYGKKLCEGTPSEVVNDPGVIEAYLGSGANA